MRKRFVRFVLILSAVTATFMVAVVAAEPFNQPTVPPSPTAVCSPAPPSHLIVHERAQVSSADPRPLNIRDGAGTAHPIIAEIPTDALLYVLEGPTCSQNYAWYRVEFNGIIGWIAEGDQHAYYVQPYPPGW